MSILDNIKNKDKTISAAPSTQETLFEQAAALRGKTRDTSASSGRVSNMAERQAKAAANLQQEQLQTQIQTQEGALQEQEKQQQAQVNTQQRQLSVQEQQIQEATLNRVEELVTQFEQGKTKLSVNKQAAALEQASFLMRLSTDKYVQELQIQGNRMRLDDRIKFEEELTMAIWEYDRDTLSQSLFVQSLINATDREFNEALKTMSVEHALEIARINSDAKNTVAKYQGFSKATSAVIKGGSEIYQHQQENANNENE